MDHSDTTGVEFQLTRYQDVDPGLTLPAVAYLVVKIIKGWEVVDAWER